MTGVTPEQVWYQGHPLGLLLAPLSWLYCAAAALRAWAFRRGWLASSAAGVPVIVVGNLTVGGTGKTPLVIWLVDWLRRRGHRPGIASRGYGGRAGAEPLDVAAGGDPALTGDEPLLLARHTGVPVVVSRDRVAAARRLAALHGCDVVVTDDGLQHYRLRRDLEILVIDGDRRLGNGRCLPAGPLREPARRMRSADLIIVNGGGDRDHAGMWLVPGDAVNLADPGRTRPIDAFRGRPVTAVAGIGHPRRFFAMLSALGLEVDPRPYPDHHRFQPADLALWPPGPVLMTEKDAVKLAGLAEPRHWYVPVQARPEARFVSALERALAAAGIAIAGGGAHGQR